jgi:hypothetical protein
VKSADVGMSSSKAAASAQIATFGSETVVDKRARW